MTTVLNPVELKNTVRGFRLRSKSGREPLSIETLNQVNWKLKFIELKAYPAEAAKITLFSAVGFNAGTSSTGYNGVG